MAFLRYDPVLRRVWLGGRRVHHGLTGVLCVIGGAWLVWDDRHDFPWQPSRDNPAGRR